jgi:hypothetical protein
LQQFDEVSRKNIEELESAAGFPTGIGRITRGECPAGGVTPMACMVCPYGHMLECHYPMTCEEANCSHYQEELAAEAEMYPPEEPGP